MNIWDSIIVIATLNWNLLFWGKESELDSFPLGGSLGVERRYESTGIVSPLHKVISGLLYLSLPRIITPQRVVVVGENNNWKNIIRAIPKQNYEVRNVYFWDRKPPRNIKQAPSIISKNSKSTDPTALENGFVEAIITSYWHITAGVIFYLLWAHGNMCSWTLLQYCRFLNRVSPNPRRLALNPSCSLPRMGMPTPSFGPGVGDIYCSQNTHVLPHMTPQRPQSGRARNMAFSGQWTIRRNGICHLLARVF